MRGRAWRRDSQGGAASDGAGRRVGDRDGLTTRRTEGDAVGKRVRALIGGREGVVGR